MAAIGIRPDR